MSDNNSVEGLAAEVALAFNSSRERSILERIVDESGFPTQRFPRYNEELVPKTVEELAESDAVVSYISSHGLLEERPLTFVEIFEKLEELGFKVSKED